ncbi:hypothetical protein FF38_11275 [Lucilia cuprina]|uniref:Uncharacterized protein n=1 Tax=Lucilia cuprina TaxID=7375 RepID=A0A0L0BNH8_LUCCU|nr:hypothetical protein CVS40_2278 [Lucilia cuprina]KNC20814.1 hypothetical protein FF38_11275 [Lucilia cuprina]
MFKDFKIEAQHCLKIHPLDIITSDNIVIRKTNDSIENFHNADKAFKNF